MARSAYAIFAFSFSSGKLGVLQECDREEIVVLLLRIQKSGKPVDMENLP